MLAIVASKDSEPHHMDVKTDLSNKDLPGNIYMEQRKSYVVQDKSVHVC